MSFAHPYHSWERGLNENTNGLIRQYFTKGSRFENIIDEEVEAVMNKLIHRPRKTLNFKTPPAVFLLNHCKRSHEYQDCASEFNPPYISMDYINFLRFLSYTETAWSVVGVKNKPMMMPYNQFECGNPIYSTTPTEPNF